MRRGIVVGAILAASIATGIAPAAATTPDRTTGPVFRFRTTDLVPGGSTTLVRYDDHVRVTFDATQLTPGDAYTMWWILFNHPEKCFSTPCSLADLPPDKVPPGFGPGNPDAGASQGWGTGLVASGTTATFKAKLKAGLAFAPADGTFGAGLVDSRAAEVHVAVRTHGPAVAGYVEAQTTLFLGGCRAGEPNVGMCSTKQISMHPVGVG